MRKVYVTVGTRAAGKTTFCEKILTLEPTVVEVSRDKILIDLFGTTTLDSYSGGHHYAYEKMWEAVEKALVPEGVSLILDVWNGCREERQRIIRRLRELGADHVVAWYFTTPLETVETWFWRKPGVVKWSEIKTRAGEDVSFYDENAPRHDHNMFHKFAVDIDSDGFDEVIRINPLLVHPEAVLRVEVSSI